MRALFALLMVITSLSLLAIASATPSPHFNSTTTTSTTATTNTTTLLYDNPYSGIQIRYPQDWAYIDSGTFLPGESFAAVIFMPARDALPCPLISFFKGCYPYVDVITILL
jgi:hypothetical protein